MRDRGLVSNLPPIGNPPRIGHVTDDDA